LVNAKHVPKETTPVPFRLRTISSDQKVCDTVTLDLLARIVPPEAIDAILTRFAAHEQRTRKLSQRSVVYLLLAVTLHGHLAIHDVVKRLWRSLALVWPSNPPTAPSRSAFAHRRDQLGARPLAALFHLLCTPLATPQTRGAFRFGLRLMAIDGTKEEVPNTRANERAFGRVLGSRGPAAFCQILCVYLAEVGTHAIVDAIIWPWDRDEREAAERLLRSVTRGMLLLVDRGLYSATFVEAVREREAHVLARISSCVKPKPVETLADGSVLARIAPRRKRTGAKTRRTSGRTQQFVRIITYRMTDPTQPGYGQTYRLVTTLLDPIEAPALELARCYHERWEIELVIDEIDTHQRLAGRPLRSKTPVGVIQEMYALLLAHYTVRALMHEAAVAANLDPDRLSFVGALRVIHDLIPLARVVSRRDLPRLYAYMLDEISRERVPERAARSSPRVIRRKMSKWPLKREKHMTWPQPTAPPEQCIELI
jgi:hypothetical protein